MVVSGAESGAVTLAVLPRDAPDERTALAPDPRLSAPEARPAAHACLPASALAHGPARHARGRAGVAGRRIMAGMRTVRNSHAAPSPTGRGYLILPGGWVGATRACVGGLFGGTILQGWPAGFCYSA